MSTISDMPVPEQLALLARGVEGLYTEQELSRRLEAAAAAGRRLRVKFGMDPTAPDIHLGHVVVLRKLRQFQDLGHKAVLIIGDYTARVGDPTGQNKTRPMLTPEEIRANAETYLDQAGRVLDTSTEKLEIRYNSEWLSEMSFADVLRLASQMTVARMLERDTFEIRYKAGVPIGVHEFLYPLMQGWDSVQIESDVELGGTDQTFNNLVGRSLQESHDQKPQIVLVMPILTGLDGAQKMSKSKGNYIGVTEAPNEMFGKVMSIPDDLMANYFTLLTDLPAERIAELVNAEATHPRDAKAILGKAIVSAFYDEGAAEAAWREFQRVFSQKQDPTDMPELVLTGQDLADGKLPLVDLIAKAGFAKSNSEARRLIKQGGVRIDNDRIDDIAAEVEPETGQVLRVGKRRFARIQLR